jgi:hypothetical protein
VELQVPAALLSELAADPPQAWAAVLTELATHATTEAPSHGSTAEPGRRGPGAVLRRYLEIRDRHCLGPGCRAPARSADVDHTQDYAQGGPTVEANLAHVCRHDHRLKHQGGWQLDQSAPGWLVWTSRLGHTYPSEPPRSSSISPNRSQSHSRAHQPEPTGIHPRSERPRS